MIVLIHVLIALASVAQTTNLFFFPTSSKFLVSYGLVAATLASGTYLVISTRASMIRACTTGLLYLGVVSLGILAARKKFATENTKIDS